MIVVVTGAGASASAGLDTTRGGDGQGLYDPRAVASQYGNHLDELWPLWSELKSDIDRLEPSNVHRAIADAGWPVITQNIDGLHTRAGSENVIEVNGNIHQARCLRCKRTYPLARQCPHCGSQRTRPDIVLFGEHLNHGRAARKLVQDATTVVYIGTSGAAAPVSDWYRLAPVSVLVNPAPWGEFTHTLPMTAEDWVSAGCPLRP